MEDDHQNGALALHFWITSIINFSNLITLMFQTRSDANKMCITQDPFDISQSFIRS
jgi:hypothetical protein